MKLLVDQNISRKLVGPLCEHFPDSSHVVFAIAENASDLDIWNYAKSQGFCIVTKDDDFEQRSILYGHPPKVIRIRLGNCKSNEIETLISTSRKIIYSFNDDSETSFLPLP